MLYLITSISKKYYVEIDRIRYPRDSVLVNYEQNENIEQYKDLKLLFKEYVGEELLTPLISYPDMETKYSIKVKDLGHQSDHITAKKSNFSWNMMPILRMPE